MTPTLYHFTCSHAAPGIETAGVIRPSLQPQLGLDPWPRLVWLTDMETPDRAALGLTSVTLKCDRTEHRFRATDTSGVVRFAEWQRGRVPFAAFAALVIGHEPARWWVAEVAVPAVRDRASA